MPDLTFPNILDIISSQKKRHTTESRAFLAWLLENIYRLDETEADDCICDGPDDKGIDGIYLNDNSETIEVFQSKLIQNITRTIGEKLLREFAGTLTQLKDRDTIESLSNSTKNIELKGRIHELNIPSLMIAGYHVKGIFVTNTTLDNTASSFLNQQEEIQFLGKQEIDELYVPADRSRPITGGYEFDLSRYNYIDFVNPEGIDVIIAPIPAPQLANITGISSGELFEPKLRQQLGKTKVNKDILESIKDTQEHGQFLLYHNGITMVCEDFTLDTANSRVTVENFFVVNGCQSLSSLYEKKDDLTDDLSIVVKIVKVGRDSQLLDKITYRSNNQNVIKPRDFKSNHAIQTRLQNEFKRQYSGSVFYEIKRGEKSDADITISNELAAKLLLAFDLRQPHTAHQTYKLFDELYKDIFSRPEVTAVRILTLNLIYETVLDKMEMINDQQFANYRLSTFFVLHLLAEALRTSERGREFIKCPEAFVSQDHGFEILDVCIKSILSDLLTDLNGELDDRARNNEPIDFKRELKSVGAVETLTGEIIGSYHKVVRRGRVESFDQEWEKTSEQYH